MNRAAKMQTLFDTGRPDSPQYCRWEPTGKPVVIDLSLDAADRMAADAIAGLTRIPRRGVEVGGILLGSAVRKNGTLIVVVEDFLAVPCDYAFGPSYILTPENRNAFRAACKQRNGADSPRPIGYYRTETHDAPRLRPEDLAILSDCFPSPDGIALVIRPRTMRASAGAFFFWEDGQMNSKSCLEFPIARPKRREHTRAPAEDRHAETEQPLKIEAGMPVFAPAKKHEAPREDEPQPRTPLPTFLGAGDDAPKEASWWWKRFKRRREAREQEDADAKPRRRVPLWASWWIKGPLIAALACSVAFMGYVVGYTTAGHLWIPARVSGNLPRDPYALSLLVFESGDNLHLTWDKDAPAIVAAQRGVLFIVDGSKSRSLLLSATQLHKESVFYHKASADVHFRLEVFLKGNRSVSETWDLNSSAPHGTPLAEEGGD